MSLLDGITAAEGWTIAKVEVETVDGTDGSSGSEGSLIEIPAPYKYTPVAAGTIRIIITITDGTKTAEFSSDELTIKPLSYSSIAPAKAKIYPEFNNQNVEAHKRE